MFSPNGTYNHHPQPPPVCQNSENITEEKAGKKKKQEPEEGEECYGMLSSAHGMTGTHTYTVAVVI